MNRYTRNQRFGLAEQLIELEALTDKKLPTSLRKAIAALAAYTEEHIPEAQAAKERAEQARKEAEKAYERDAIASIVEQVAKGKAPSLLPDSRPEAEKAAKEAETLHQLMRKAANAHYGYLVGLAAGDEKVWEWNEGIYAETVAWSPNENTPYSAILAHQNNAGAVLELCESIALQIEAKRAEAAGDGMTQQERKQLKQRFEARPLVMPTLEDVRAANRHVQDESPLAKAERARAQDAARQREQNIKDAARNAAARAGAYSE